jgi:hypothetical protein
MSPSAAPGRCSTSSSKRVSERWSAAPAGALPPCLLVPPWRGHSRARASERVAAKSAEKPWKARRCGGGEVVVFGGNASGVAGCPSARAGPSSRSPASRQASGFGPERPASARARSAAQPRGRRRRSGPR